MDVSQSSEKVASDLTFFFFEKQVNNIAMPTITISAAVDGEKEEEDIAIVKSDAMLNYMATN